MGKSAVFMLDSYRDGGVSLFGGRDVGRGEQTWVRGVSRYVPSFLQQVISRVSIWTRESRRHGLLSSNECTGKLQTTILLGYNLELEEGEKGRSQSSCEPIS